MADGNDPNIGNNLGIDSDTILALAEKTADTYAKPLLDRANEIADAADKWKSVTLDDTNETQANDFKAQILALESDTAAGHKAAKDPYLNGGRAIDAKKNEILELLGPSKTIILDKINDLLRRRDDEQKAAARKAQEEADRAAAEAAELAEKAGQDDGGGVAAEVAAKQAQEDADEKAKLAKKVATTKVKTKGSTGRATSFVTRPTIKITNLGLAVRSVLDDTEVLDAITKALMRKVKANRAAVAKGQEAPHIILGVEIGEEKTAR